MYIYISNGQGTLNSHYEIHNAVFYDNDGNQGGGAIYIHNGGSGDLFQLEVHNITANNNRASSGNGGAIYIYSQGSTNNRVSITNSQFIITMQIREVEEQYMNQ